MKILCTGNKEKLTIAWAITKRYPDADIISLSTGWNLRLDNQHDVDKFIDKISCYDVFINSSYIAPGNQARLMQITIDRWMELDIKGHIINIGTTAEWDENLQNNEYVKSKINLRNLSLYYNQQTGITGVKTTYLVLGGVDNQQPENRDFVDPMNIVQVIDWVLSFPDRIALIHLDRAK